jgi:hypothetical protein
MGEPSLMFIHLNQLAGALNDLHRANMAAQAIALKAGQMNMFDYLSLQETHIEGMEQATKDVIHAMDTAKQTTG